MKLNLNPSIFNSETGKYEEGPTYRRICSGPSIFYVQDGYVFNEVGEVLGEVQYAEQFIYDSDLVSKIKEQ